MGDGIGKILKKKEVEEIFKKKGLPKKKVDTFAEKGILIAHGKDVDDNRWNIYYEHCVLVKLEIFLASTRKSRKNGYKYGYLKDKLIHEFGEEDEILMNRLEEETIKEISSDFIKKNF